MSNPNVRVRFLCQQRLSTDGHNIRDFFKGEELVLSLELADSTILHASHVKPVAEIIDENPGEEVHEAPPTPVEPRGTLPDEKSIEEAEEAFEKEEDEKEAAAEEKQEKIELENKQEDIDPKKETETVHKSSKLKNGKKK